jgi:hypothetical protein
MRFLVAVVLSFVTACWSIHRGYGGWGPSGCGQVVPAGAASVAFTGWKIITPAVEQRYFREGKLIGSWLEREHRWFAWRAERWVEERPPWTEACACGCARCTNGCECKNARPCGDERCTCGMPNFGLDLAHLAGGSQPCYRVGDKPCRKRDVLAAIVEDDSAKLRLTIIGNREERARVLAALPPEASRYLVKAYDPSDWAVTRAGFKTDGHPTIYVQAPDGTVLHRQDTFADAKQLAEALRKAVPLALEEFLARMRIPHLDGLVLTRYAKQAVLQVASADLTTLLASRGPVDVSPVHIVRPVRVYASEYLTRWRLNLLSRRIFALQRQLSIPPDWPQLRFAPRR